MSTKTSEHQFQVELEEKGYARLPGVVPDWQIRSLVDDIDRSRSDLTAPGMRKLLSLCPAVRHFAQTGSVFSVIAQILGRDAKPVRAILFDKSPAANWYVTWHQDLSIPVTNRVDVPGFGPWSIKKGIIHVQPPAEILEQMLSARIHIDDCELENGPVRFIPGSHKAGILDPSGIDLWRQRESETCTAKRGDVILMRPLILHSSPKSDHPSRRRVLHVEYENASLPSGLEWAEA